MVSKDTPYLTIDVFLNVVVKTKFPLFRICSIKFLHNSKIPAKLWQDPASIEGEEQNKKNVPTWD